MDWINIEEQLPKQEEKVLLIIERDAWKKNGAKFRKREIAIGWLVNNNWHVDGCNAVVALYWMPLPKIPRKARKSE